MSDVEHRPILSIVTGTWNRRESFLRLVRSIERTTPFHYEVIVSDCSDPGQEFLGGELPRVRVLREWPKETMVRGFNAAFRATRGKWVAWLNDDVEVLPGWATAAVAFMEGHPEVGVGAIYYSHGPTPPFFVNRFCDTTYANFGIVEREFGERLGWFDEDLRMFGSDNAICFKSLLAGRPVVGIAGAKVIHHAPQDAQREHNERSFRERDADACLGRYRDRVPEMLAVERRFAHLQPPAILA